MYDLWDVNCHVGLQFHCQGIGSLEVLGVMMLHLLKCEGGQWVVTALFLFLRSLAGPQKMSLWGAINCVVIIGKASSLEPIAQKNLFFSSSCAVLLWVRPLTILEMTEELHQLFPRYLL